MILWMTSLAMAGVLEVTPVPGVADDPVDDRVYEALVDEQWALAATLLDEREDLSPAHALWRAIAAYETGDVRHAEWVTAQGLQDAPDDPGLRVLHALALADQGKGRDALAIVAGVPAAAPAVWRARAELLTGIVCADLGRTSDAVAATARAMAAAEASGHAGLIRRARDQHADLTAFRAGDLVGRVGDALARGQVSRAAGLAVPQGSDARAMVRAAIAQAMVARAERSWSRAVDKLSDAVVRASRHGLVREQIAAELEMGRVLLLAGDAAEGDAALARAEAIVTTTSFVLREIDVRVARATRAARSGARLAAEAQLDRVRRLAASVDHPHVGARVLAVEGWVKQAGDDLEGAQRALLAASATWSTLGLHAEAAREALGAVRLAARLGSGVDDARAQATAAFGAAGDASGPAHVALAVGLGQADAQRLDDALGAFVEAYRHAREVGDAHLAGVAEENVAQVLAATGHSEASIARARDAGMGDVVARQARYREARADFEAGRIAYDAKRHPEARQAFFRAEAVFVALGDEDAANEARRSGAWAGLYALSQDPKTGSQAWDALQAVSDRVDDPELVVRVRAGAAIAGARRGTTHARDALQTAATMAEDADLPVLAAQVWGALAELPGDLDERAAAAERAWSLEPRRAGPWALYEVAYAAWEADDARRVLVLLRPDVTPPDDLSSAWRELRDAAKAWLKGSETE